MTEKKRNCIVVKILCYNSKGVPRKYGRLIQLEKTSDIKQILLKMCLSIYYHFLSNKTEHELLAKHLKE